MKVSAAGTETGRWEGVGRESSQTRGLPHVESQARPGIGVGSSRSETGGGSASQGAVTVPDRRRCGLNRDETGANEKQLGRPQ